MLTSALRTSMDSFGITSIHAILMDAGSVNIAALPQVVDGKSSFLRLATAASGTTVGGSRSVSRSSSSSSMSSLSEASDASSEESEAEVEGDAPTTDRDVPPSRRTVEAAIEEVARAQGVVVARCLLHLLHNAIRSWMTKSAKTAARSTLRAWNGWLWGQGCEPRRARWATFVAAFRVRRSRGATLMKEVDRQVEATSQHGVSYVQAWDNLQQVRGMPQRRWLPTATETWDAILQWLRDQIIALHPAMPRPTTGANVPDAFGTRFSSEFAATAYLADNVAAAQEFVREETTRYRLNVQHGNLERLITGLSEPSLTADLHATVLATARAVEVMNRLGAGRVKAHSVQAEFENLLLPGMVEAGLAHEIRNRWESTSAVWEAARLFSPGFVACSSACPDLASFFVGRKLPWRITVEMAEVYAAFYNAARVDPTVGTQVGDPVSFWRQRADGVSPAAELARVAVEIVSLSPSTSSIEGLMSRYTWMRDKRRSRLSTRRAARMCFAVGNPQLFDMENDAPGRSPRERVTASPQPASPPTTPHRDEKANE